MIRLLPPLVDGDLATERGDRGREVRGKVVGRRADVVDTVNAAIDWAVLPMFRGVSRAVAGAAGVTPWAAVTLRFGRMHAAFNLVAGGWQPVPSGLRVAHVDPALAPWLRSHLDGVGRTLDAHASSVASVKTAWELARLHLVLREVAQAAEAVRRGLEIIESTGARVPDPAAGWLLADQCDEFDLRDVAAALRAALPG